MGVAVGTRILVVEDEALIADDIQRSLERLGYDVPEAAYCGLEAVERAKDLHPDLVLMDVQLRGPMDGIEAATRIRADRDVPVIYLTSHSDEATLARAKMSRPHGYLLKPFDDRELRTAIEIALSKHALETRLAEREKWFSTTLQSIADAVIATDPANVVTFMNGVAERLTGWSRGDASGRKLHEVFSIIEAGGAPADAGVHAPATRGAVRPNAFALAVRGGATIEIEHTTSPIVDEAGEVLGAVVVFRDVTDRKRLEQRLNETERLASIGRMAAGLGHEINNPLAYVLANVEFSLDRIRDVMASGALAADPGAAARVRKQLEEVQEALGDAAHGASRVGRIVQDLKRFSRGDESQRRLTRVEAALERAAQLTGESLRHQARIDKQFGATPAVEANADELTQLFAHLLLNAAQAIERESSERHTVCLRTFTDRSGRATVEVRDTGSGISPEHLPRIFDPFFTTKPIGSGMGLGLSISHEIVTKLGGEIEVQSAVGQGTIVRVALPPGNGSA
jgi:hypothetical protein